MITALIRTHPGREEKVKQAIRSAHEAGCFIDLFQGEKTEGYDYNLYCNTLKARIVSGYFFFLDSDDIVLENNISAIRSALKPDHANIVQMVRRRTMLKPRNPEMIRRGHIGMPCLILHASYAGLADITATEDGDWQWIEAVLQQLPLNFIPLPLVYSERRNRGN